MAPAYIHTNKQDQTTLTHSSITLTINTHVKPILDRIVDLDYKTVWALEPFAFDVKRLIILSQISESCELHSHKHLININCLKMSRILDEIFKL